MIRVASIGIIALILTQSIWLLSQFQQLWQVGVEHLQEAVTVLDGVEDGRVLFLNFPDRYAPENPPYPIGYWGLTLAPVVVELADFQAIVTGGNSQSLSRAVPWVDEKTREAGPYQVDMRGVITPPDELVTMAEMTAIYLTRYLPDGRFQLQYAGQLQPETAAECPLARFGEDICLHEVQVLETAEATEVTLVWSTAAPLPAHLTIFTHLGQPGQPPLSQADGDTWRGVLPLANWPPGTLIVEQRTLPKPPDQAGLALQIGVYNWVDGERLPGAEVIGGAERPLLENAWRLEIGD
jgi:hypothetical protein